MSKHTPGQWVAVEVGHYGAGDNIMPLFEVHSGECAVVCENLKETDARLIAAAPAMLEALEMAVRQNEHDMLMTGEELRKCAAAIRAAKGEA
jgi:hypothetical protein